MREEAGVDENGNFRDSRFLLPGGRPRRFLGGPSASALSPSSPDDGVADKSEAFLFVGPSSVSSFINEIKPNQTK